VSAWQDLVTASLMGTERAAVPAVPVPGSPGREGAPADPAALLLDQAALLTAARRGGRRPERAEPLAAAEPDTVPAVRRAARIRLARMLGGEHPDLLAEWLAAVAGRGRRVPAQSLPALLHQARRGLPADSELRRLVAAAGGPRARWLAGLNPEWAFVLSYAPAGEDAWRLGDAAQRRGYLSALRARDPGAARDLVAESWDAAGPDERVMFLRAIAGGLSLADEPLLEGALDDRHAWVRKAAADLLAALPGSALGQRMADRARGHLRLERGIFGARLLVSPPAGCDAAMRRDGITPDTGAAEPGGRDRLLLELIARTPLRTWTGGFGMRPAEILARPAGGWEALLFSAWSRAAIIQSRQDQGGQDREAQAWMAALIGQALETGPSGMRGDYGVLGKLARRADPALGAPGVLPVPEPGVPPVLDEAVKVLRFRYEMHEELKHDNGAG
jgi:Family of unknown function (DUF5691)